MNVKFIHTATLWQTKRPCFGSTHTAIHWMISNKLNTKDAEKQRNKAQLNIFESIWQENIGQEGECDVAGTFIGYFYRQLIKHSSEGNHCSSPEHKEVELLFSE